MTEKKLEVILKDILDKNPLKFVEIIENQYKNYREKYGDNLSDYDKLQTQILFDGRNINDYFFSLEAVDYWLEKCFDDIRNNLHMIRYPLYVHLYLSMIQKNFWKEGYLFLEKYKFKFLLFNEEILRLSQLKDPLNKSDPVVSKFLNKKTHLYIPKTIFLFFIHFLDTNNLILVLDIINKFFERSDQISENDGFSNDTLNDQPLDLMQIDNNSLTTVEKKKQKKIVDSNHKGNNKIKEQKKALGYIDFSIQDKSTDQENLKVDQDNLPTVGCYTILNTHNKMNCSDLANDGSIIAFGFKDGMIFVWILQDNFFNLNDSKEVSKEVKESESKLIITNDLKIIIPSEIEKGAYEEIIKNYKTVKFKGHCGSIFSVNISPDRKYLISGSYDETIRLWSFFEETPLSIYKGHFSPVLSVKFSPNSFYFASGGSDRTAKLWSITQKGVIRVFVGHLSDVEIVDFHPNSLFLITSSNDKTIRLWDIENGNCIRVFSNSINSYVDSLNFSNSGKFLVVGCNKNILVFDITKNQDPLKIIENLGSKNIYSLALDNLDRVLCYTSEDYKISFLDFNGILNSDLEKIDLNITNKLKCELICSYVTKKTAILNTKFTTNNILLTLGRFDDNNPKIFM